MPRIFHIALLQYCSASSYCVKLRPPEPPCASDRCREANATTAWATAGSFADIQSASRSQRRASRQVLDSLQTKEIEGLTLDGTEAYVDVVHGAGWAISRLCSSSARSDMYESRRVSCIVMVIVVSSAASLRCNTSLARGTCLIAFNVSCSK